MAIKYHYLSTSEISALQLFIIRLGGTNKAAKILDVTTGAIYNWKNGKNLKITLRYWDRVKDGVLALVEKSNLDKVVITIDNKQLTGFIDANETVEVITPERQKMIGIMAIPINPKKTQWYWMDKDKNALAVKDD